MHINTPFYVFVFSTNYMIFFLFSDPLYENLTCETDPFELDCGPTGLVVLSSALYGRSKKENRCRTSKTDHCIADVLKPMDVTCSGKRKCKISNLANHFKKFCNKRGLRNAITTTYNCIRGISLIIASHFTFKSANSYIVGVSSRRPRSNFVR